MTRDEAITIARGFCESPSELVRVLQDEALQVAVGDPGVGVYAAPPAPYWVIPLRLPCPQSVGARTVVLVSDAQKPMIARVGE